LSWVIGRYASAGQALPGGGFVITHGYLYDGELQAPRYYQSYAVLVGLSTGCCVSPRPQAYQRLAASLESLL
jgi:hypothetical protein